MVSRDCWRVDHNLHVGMIRCLLVSRPRERHDVVGHMRRYRNTFTKSEVSRSIFIPGVSANSISGPIFTGDYSMGRAAIVITSFLPTVRIPEATSKTFTSTVSFAN